MNLIVIYLMVTILSSDCLDLPICSISAASTHLSYL